MVNLDFQSIFKIWNSYPQSLNLNLEEGQLEFPINCQNLELLSTKFEFELARGSTWISNQFLRIGTPTHKIWIWTWKRVNLNFQFMKFNELTSTIIKNWIFTFGKKITFWNFNLKKKLLATNSASRFHLMQLIFSKKPLKFHNRYCHNGQLIKWHQSEARRSSKGTIAAGGAVSKGQEGQEKEFSGGAVSKMQEGQ